MHLAWALSIPQCLIYLFMQENKFPWLNKQIQEHATSELNALVYV